VTAETTRSARQWQAEGAARFRSRDLVGAEAALREAARADPSEPEYLLHLAEVARAAGRTDDGVAWLVRASEVVGDGMARRNALAAAWLAADRPAEALDAALRSLGDGDSRTSGNADGDVDTARRLFVEALRRMRRPPPAAARAMLARAMREGWARQDLLGGLAVRFLRTSWPASANGMATDELLAELLVSAPVGDPEMEARLRATRRDLLMAAAGKTSTAGAMLDFAARLARQCFLNEYAWPVTPEEARTVDDIAAALAIGPITAAQLLALASYRGLADVPGVDAMVIEGAPTAVTSVLTQQVTLLRAAREAGLSVPTLTPLTGAVTQAVQAQYEANPYPCWDRLADTAPLPIDRLLKALFPQAALQPIPNASAPDILAAGCGAGQEALVTARRHPTARVLAVDLSRASLGYGVMKASEFGVANVAWGQADLMALDQDALGGRSFDVVVSSGVLHHLADPIAGARRLASLLRPGGVIKLGLYSARARARLAPAKALARRFPPTDEGLRALRAAILAAPIGDPVRQVLGIGDFYALSACRDLLMHVQEHELTIPDLARMLDVSGLRFLGFALGARELAAYRRAFPGDPGATSLESWDAFEQANPDTFIGMYQFWAQKPA
jgi:2-polyprenyl-3-methyl-5-hydroxy-6-metoxy-1,4-benzoquinol methylase/tetratricopeptide (TPR) repeat protein